MAYQNNKQNNDPNSVKNNPNAKILNMNATAPYNFIQLPDNNRILPSKLVVEGSLDDVSDIYSEYIDKTEKLSGTIDLDMKLLSPLFIRADDGKTIAPIFDNMPIIPGSSIRGMVKNLFKIITCGAWRENEDYTQRHIYYRCIMASNSSPAWMNPLHDLYMSRMTSGIGVNTKKNAKPGFLLKIKNQYFIARSSLINPKRMFIKEYTAKYRCKIGIRNDSRIDWHNGEAYIITGSQKESNLYTAKAFANLPDDKAKKRAGKQQIRYINIKDMDKCRSHWLEVPQDVIEDYRDDIKRKGVNLLDYKKTSNSKGDYNGAGVVTGEDLKKLIPNIDKDIESLIPCFFLEENNRVSAFGHGQCFRIPYKNSVADAIPKALRSDTIDFSDAVFGKKELWGSRVFFEDAEVKAKAIILEQKKVILGEPNPTSYQLYLKQRKGQELVHWDDKKTQIRGYKMYWHRNFQDSDWKNLILENKGKDNENDNVTTKIKPIATGTEFSGKIRFQNLSKEELGALMMVFDLNGNKNKCAYRLGQGKSMGLGSVDIKAKLKLDTKEGYESLFGNDGWLDSAKSVSEAEYLEAFRDYLNQKEMSSSWEKIMTELVNILSVENLKKSDWNMKVETMPWEDNKPNSKFLQRIPIKTISEVLQ